jgi:hypothetical protein
VDGEFNFSAVYRAMHGNLPSLGGEIDTWRGWLREYQGFRSKRDWRIKFWSTASLGVTDLPCGSSPGFSRSDVHDANDPLAIRNSALDEQSHLLGEFSSGNQDQSSDSRSGIPTLTQIQTSISSTVRGGLAVETIPLTALASKTF